MAKKKGRPRISEDTVRIHVLLTWEQREYLLEQGEMSSAVRFLIDLAIARSQAKQAYQEAKIQDVIHLSE